MPLQTKKIPILMFQISTQRLSAVLYKYRDTYLLSKRIERRANVFIGIPAAWHSTNGRCSSQTQLNHPDHTFYFCLLTIHKILRQVRPKIRPRAAQEVLGTCMHFLYSTTTVVDHQRGFPKPSAITRTNYVTVLSKAFPPSWCQLIEVTACA